MTSQRKIDVFILIDISGSMTGEPIHSLNCAIENVINTLSADQLAIGRIRLCIQTYNAKLYEINQLELVESLLFNFNSLGIASGPTHSGEALKKVLYKVHETVQEYHKQANMFKKPLLIHVTDGFPSDIGCYEEIVEKLKREKINRIGCGIGAAADLKSLKAFSNKVIILEKNDQESIILFSQLLSKIILFYLYSDNDDLDSLEILNPTKPNNPILTEKIKIV
jgi:uncharacterized protein YegL